MQDLVGIVRTESEMEQALEKIARSSRTSGTRVGIAGNRQYNNGWHTAMDLDKLARSSPRPLLVPRCSVKRAEARSFAKTFPTKTPNGANTTSSLSAARMEKCGWRSALSAPMPDELKAVIEEMK